LLLLAEDATIFMQGKSIAESCCGSFSLILLPLSQAVLMEKLKYAIHFCKSIDTDDYARVAMGDPTSHTASEESDLESVIFNPLNAFDF